ncbi:iron chelate uptake ABC transporter family permease subunit [Loktanella sp. F6476L]|uniref:iron chelate uptake ABC transporter family permease subunit n=1 Tax=Loktanella sp. F6476L TaxID=2926405 RepID=UPI001FF55BE2|nr:iron chelate uptake ABC transporter family permease subunit [Loktanella sp. F6476L]MCK0119526.1 iron chelate uptake ABC transporter family permease subunit [Loktanella sp. F6476L]
MVERRLFFLIGLLVVACGLFLFWNLRSPMGFILSLRFTKIAALCVVGAAIGTATVLFQTIASNRMLTPGIVGFDALFVFIQTALVLTLGSVGFAALPSLAQFGMETAILVIAAVALFSVLLRNGAEDILRLVLTGVILGVLLRGLAGLAQRMLDPSEFSIVQQATFATFGAVDETQLAVAAVILGASLFGALKIARYLDVVALGRNVALPLGVDYDRVAFMALGLVALLVATSTALVGPITFLGLLASSLAHAVLPSWRHTQLLPAAAVIGATILVSGQFVFERLLGLQSTLTVVVEFVGGVLFLFLVLRRSKP